jgi:hypothetical protein
MIVTEEPKPEETAAEIQETPAVEATSGGIVEEDAEASAPAAAAHKEHKDNVIDTIKKGPLGKFFKKKETTEHAKEEVTTEAAVDTTETVEETPVAEATEAAAVETAGKFSK